LTQSARRHPDGAALAASALAGDRRATARLLTLIENGDPQGQIALAKLYSYTGQAHVVGFTGSTGAGKSTLVNAVAREFRERGPALAIVAVDPTSPYSGGALLGDRVRMRDLSDDPGVFIRSMASRGHPGGVAHATRDVITVLDALGVPVVLVETVGAGQAQVEVTRVAHTVVLVEAPGMGDEVQALKAGLMEIADIVVVNKADRPEARQTLQAIRSARLVGRFAERERTGGTTTENGSSSAHWSVPVLEASALERTGISDLIDAIVAHRMYLTSSGLWETVRADHARADVEAWLDRKLRTLAHERLGEARVAVAIDAVLKRDRDPAAAAQDLVAELVSLLGGRAAAAGVEQVRGDLHRPDRDEV
jgi:LAO/AO transport system kinase